MTSLPLFRKLQALMRPLVSLLLVAGLWPLRLCHYRVACGSRKPLASSAFGHKGQSPGCGLHR